MSQSNTRYRELMMLCVCVCVCVCCSFGDDIDSRVYGQVKCKIDVALRDDKKVEHETLVVNLSSTPRQREARPVEQVRCEQFHIATPMLTPHCRCAIAHARL
jgi:hypothetical protein